MLSGHQQRRTLRVRAWRVAIRILDERMEENPYQKTIHIESARLIVTNCRARQPSSIPTCEGLTLQEAMEDEGSGIARAFCYRPPRFFFRLGKQEMLRFALIYLRYHMEELRPVNLPERARFPGRRAVNE